MLHFKSFCATSTDSHYAATANLLREIIMVRDNFLTLLGWYTRDDIKDIISSICVSWTVCYTCLVCFLLVLNLLFFCFSVFYLHCLLCLCLSFTSRTILILN